jgi:tetratricopeptide (TPR) repeat protein
MKTAELIEAAFASHRAGELDTAETLYRQVLAAEAHNLNALQLLGALVSTAERAAEAVALLQRARDVLLAAGPAQPQHAALYFNLGRAQALAGRRADAIDSFRSGIALSPEVPELHAHLAGECYAEGDFAAAAAGFQAALALAPQRVEWWHDLAMTHAAAGCLDDAIAAYRQAVAAAPDQPRSRRALARLLILQNRTAEAAEELATLTAQHPEEASLHGELGKLQLTLEQTEAARASFTRVLALCPDDAEAHYLLGRILQQEGDAAGAEAAYRHALAAHPAAPDVLFQLGQLLQADRARGLDAIAVFEDLLDAAPDHADAHAALGIACRGAGQIDRALALFERYLALRPDAALAHFHVGWTLGLAQRHEEAAGFLRRAIALDSSRTLHHFANVLLGNALQSMGRDAEARQAYLAALAEQPVASMQACPPGRTPAFTLLMVLAPGLYNTPYEYLIQQDEYEVNVALLVPGYEHDIAVLRGAGDIVFNLISDADRNHALLPAARALIDGLGKPVINHPDLILPTDRQRIATLLGGIPGCRVATIRRHGGLELLDSPASALPAAPFLARRVGRHNGDEFERIELANELYHFVAGDIAADYYLMDYIDYRSPDGFFRKYRFFFVDDAILPYHLAIGADWKVHHVNTDMASHDWMQREEAAFLRAPDLVFGQAQMDALRGIRAAVGLDFFGIDCALDAEGRVVVFEANATMLVHAHNENFPYRNEHVARIKQAFGAMLARRASSKRP